jgi:hypothetical protein
MDCRHRTRAASRALAIGVVALVSVGGPTIAFSDPGNQGNLGDECPRGKVLDQSHQAKLVKKRRRLIGCMAGGAPYQVAYWDFGGVPKWQKPLLRGHMVAIELLSARAQSYSLRVVDLRRRKWCYNGTIGTGRVRGGTPEDYGEPLRDIVLRRSGAVAYIAGPGSGPRATGEFPNLAPWSGYEVVVVDRRGARQVAAGPDIEVGSLEIDGARVTWRQGGTKRSARFRYRAGCNVEHTWYRSAPSQRR